MTSLTDEERAAMRAARNRAARLLGPAYSREQDEKHAMLENLRATTAEHRVDIDSQKAAGQ